ncbi:hypothetical protein OM076_26045 [Solirubrobacter ginsenosidimutans]|uniref:Uncharacterized protein n=1 Tax=Solirubrobacter ginsenosidimutans TaxID=490573 RepID=A0A9X3MW28_9ACTN|nr:hypothetical protein [Solirubrobacter ginsenosidimutans]MDA0163759.1 hypothetical protein [Solirubrobacter ginsenosidimutans]
MRPQLVPLLGVLALAIGAAPLGFLLREQPATPRAWAKSPPEAPLAAPKPPAHWDLPARESLALLRRTTAAEAKRSLTALSSCESHAGRRSAKRRNRDYRRCATPPLARVHAFASANSHMLSNLANASKPARECRGRVLALSGMASTLAFTTNSTLRGGLDAPWDELLDASRSIRGLAAETLRLAREPGWSSTCKPQPGARPPAAPVL